MEMTEETLQKVQKLAREVLTLSRNTLLVQLRFLDVALSRLELIPAGTDSLMTEGIHVFYDPIHVLRVAKAEQQASVRDYLHMVFHCLFRHMRMDPKLDREYWDLACDIAVENAISELGLSCTRSAREAKQAAILSGIRNELKLITAEKLYHYLVGSKAQKQKVAELRGLFYADDHSVWYMTASQILGLLGQSGSDDTGNGQKTDSQQNGDPKENQNGDKNSDQGSEQDSSGGSALQSALTDSDADWRQIAEQIQTDLETFSQKQGSNAGSLTQNLQAVTREKYDYTTFLRRFATMHETMRLNPDEFDYVYYTYGLQLYKNLPLIEPLEYREEKLVDEFVIAIDTSGSTSGKLVQTFLQKTFNILKSTESFARRVNVHIIQCDAEIQEHVKITTQAEFDRYIKTMQIHGLGGTDFRPVFTLVDRLIVQKEFNHLKGMIYFTDGYGTFPHKKPAYETAFVFIRDDYGQPDVPPWAIRLVLDKEDI